MNKLFFKELICFSIIFFLSALMGCKNKNERTFSECGISIDIPPSYEEKGLELEAFGTEVSVYPVFLINFNHKSATEAIKKEYDALEDADVSADVVQDFNERFLQHYKNILTIYLVPQKEYEDLYVSGQLPESMQKLKENDGYVYLLDIAEEETEGMDEEEKANYLLCRSFAIKAKDKIKYSTVQSASYTGDPESETATTLPQEIGEFSSYTLDGEEVSSDIFREADITVVNVWGTFCAPCIQEMPDLAEWAASLPVNVRLLGIICDVNGIEDEDGISEAKEIVENTGASTFTHILGTSSMNGILDKIVAVPTTFFVDKNGYIQGLPIVGARIDDYKEALTSYLNRTSE